MGTDWAMFEPDNITLRTVRTGVTGVMVGGGLQLSDVADSLVGSSVLLWI